MSSTALLSRVRSWLSWRVMGPRTAADAMIEVDTFISEHRLEAVAECEAQAASAPQPRARFLRLVCAELARLHRQSMTAAQSLAARRAAK